MGERGGAHPPPPFLFPGLFPFISPAMPLTEAILQALQTVWSHKLRSFFTLLGIIVSVAFLIAVVAVIQGMNAYVRERLAGSGTRSRPRRALCGARPAGRASDRPAVGMADTHGGRRVAQQDDRRRVRVRRHRPLSDRAGLPDRHEAALLHVHLRERIARGELVVLHDLIGGGDAEHE